MGSYSNGVYVPLVDEVGWGEEFQDFLTRSGKQFIDVTLAPYGADPTGVTDSSAAVVLAIAALGTNKGTIYFPPGTYKWTTPVDLTQHQGITFLGGSDASRNGQSRIVASGSPSSIFHAEYVGAGAQSLDIAFRNLRFDNSVTPIRISDYPEVRFVNCSFAPEASGSADSCGVLLENTFWISFDKCKITAASTSQPSVIIRGKSPAPNVDVSFLIKFNDIILETGGVWYEQNTDNTGGNAGRFEFTNVSTENFASSGLLEIHRGAGVALWNTIRYIYMEGCGHFDASGNCSIIKMDADAGNISDLTFIDCPPTGSASGCVEVANAVGPSVSNIFAHSSGGVVVTGGAAYPVVYGFVEASNLGLRVVQRLDAARAAIRLYRETDEYDQAQFQIWPDGKHEWGAGGANPYATPDTNLYRSAANALKTDDSFLVGSALTISPSGYIQGLQIADPAAPGANMGRVYIRNNGAGKMQLVVRFPTGAVQVVATEP